MTTGEIQAHLADVYGTDVSRELISKITDAVNEELVARRDRPLGRICAVMYIDAIVVNRPLYVVVGFNLDG